MSSLSSAACARPAVGTLRYERMRVSGLELQPRGSTSACATSPPITWSPSVIEPRSMSRSIDHFSDDPSLVNKAPAAFDEHWRWRIPGGSGDCTAFIKPTCRIALAPPRRGERYRPIAPRIMQVMPAAGRHLYPFLPTFPGGFCHWLVRRSPLLRTAHRQCTNPTAGASLRLHRTQSSLPPK